MSADSMDYLHASERRYAAREGEEPTAAPAIPEGAPTRDQIIASLKAENARLTRELEHAQRMEGVANSTVGRAEKAFASLTRERDEAQKKYTMLLGSLADLHRWHLASLPPTGEPEFENPIAPGQV